MGRLIDGLLIFSRLGRMEMSHEPVNLRQLTEEAMQELQPEIEGREIEWRIGELPVVQGNREMLRTVVVNLLSNAIKRAPPAPGPNRGRLSGARGGEAVCFVRDNGVGFDMVRGQTLRRLPAPAPRQGLRGHGNRPGKRAAHHPASLGPSMGRERGRARRYILFLSSLARGASQGVLTKP